MTSKHAWTTLLSHPDYLVGVRALRKSLQRSETRWPLVVMVTARISPADRRAVEQMGCIVHPVDAIHPPTDLQASYATARFDQTWTKLRAWQLVEFDRVVLLDADMLVLQNMDELFTWDLQDNLMAACHACRCNPERVSTYPAQWRPERCHYTWQERGDPPPAALDNYLNSGLIVLRPDVTTMDILESNIAAIADLSAYPFSEQDFLNELFAQHWLPLPYGYNALKTLPYQHSRLWRWSEVKNLHYILDKPWQRDLTRRGNTDDRYYALDKMWWDIADSE